VELPVFDADLHRTEIGTDPGRPVTERREARPATTRDPNEKAFEPDAPSHESWDSSRREAASSSWQQNLGVDRVRTRAGLFATGVKLDSFFP
jgi:hypothetical protein